MYIYILEVPNDCQYFCTLVTKSEQRKRYKNENHQAITRVTPLFHQYIYIWERSQFNIVFCSTDSSWAMIWLKTCHRSLQVVRDTCHQWISLKGGTIWKRHTHWSIQALILKEVNSLTKTIYNLVNPLVTKARIVFTGYNKIWEDDQWERPRQTDRSFSRLAAT